MKPIDPGNLAVKLNFVTPLKNEVGDGSKTIGSARVPYAKILLVNDNNTRKPESAT